MELNLNNTNNMLDALYLELLGLIEQQVSCKVNIERATNAGQLFLAKTRYNQGSQAVSLAQIPTQNSEEVKALAHVTEEPNVNSICGGKKSLIINKVDKGEGYLDPIRWFSLLPPSSLRNAAQEYKISLDYIVESANIQAEMLAIMKNIHQLKSIKQNF